MRPPPVSPKVSPSRPGPRHITPLLAGARSSSSMGLGDPALVYEEEKDLFRFAEDGVFAFSREHANWGRLRNERGTAFFSSRSRSYA
jgi:hypothetical protein